MRIAMDQRLMSYRQVEQQLEVREATFLSEQLLRSRGLNPDHEAMLGLILQEHFLRRVQQRKNDASASAAIRPWPVTVPEPHQSVQPRGCNECEIQMS